MTYTDYLTAALIVLIIMYIVYSKFQFREVCKPSNGVIRQWNVLGRYSNNDEAANTMARLHSWGMELFRRLKKKYYIGATGECVELRALLQDPQFCTKRELIRNLLRHYNPELTYENDSTLNPGTTSYTINKESMHMCLRKKYDPNIIEDFSVLQFVFMHECLHIANRDIYGHPEAFWDSFKFLLREAHSVGMYTPVDYSKHPVVFCGLAIRNNPFYD